MQTRSVQGVAEPTSRLLPFERDAQGRIIKVIAPDNSELRYEYDAAGDLVAMVDAKGQRTTFTYSNGHYLKDIIDPRGVRVSRQEFDADGRLTAVIDADGQRIEYDRDIDGRNPGSAILDTHNLAQSWTQSWTPRSAGTNPAEHWRGSSSTRQGLATQRGTKSWAEAGTG